MKIWEVFNFNNELFHHEPLQQLLLKFALGYKPKRDDIEIGMSDLTPSDYDKLFLIDFKRTDCSWLMVQVNEFGIRKDRGFSVTIDFDFRTLEDIKGSDQKSGPTKLLKSGSKLKVDTNMEVYK